MTVVSRPFSAALVELLAALAGDGSGAADARMVLAELDAGGWHVDGYALFEAADGLHVRFRLPQAAQARLTAPGLPQVRLAVEVADPSGSPVVEIVDASAGDWTEIRGLRVAVGVTPDLLRPLDPAQSAVMVTVDGVVRVERDWSLTLVPSVSVSLPESQVAGTGLTVSLDDLTFDLSAKTARAGGGAVRILSPCVFAGAGGLRLDAQELELGVTGLSCGLRASWKVDHDGTVIQPTSEALGHLLAAEWPVALEAAAIELVDNLPRLFTVTGFVGVPLLAAVLGVEFGLGAGAGGGLSSTARLETLGPITASLGAGTLGVDRIVLDGTLADDELAAHGTLDGLALTLDPLDIRLSSVDVSVSHKPAGDELRIALGQVPLGPLGRVDGAELVLGERRDWGTTSPYVQVEAGIAWPDIASRIGLPPGFPAPGAGQARVSVRWDSGGVAVRLSAAIDDPHTLFDVLPAAFRPQIEEAELLVEIAYADAAAFNAAPTTGSLAGSASVGLVIRLPQVPGIPGLAAVTTGDATGRVHARARVADGPTGEPQLAVELTDLVTIELSAPGIPASQIRLTLELDSVHVEVGAGSTGTVRLAGSGSLRGAPGGLPPLASYADDLVAQFGLPGELGDLLGQLARAAPDQGTFELTVPFDGSAPAVVLALRPSDPPRFKLLEQLGKLANPSGRAPSDATPLPGLGSPPDFFEVAPGELRLSALLSDSPEIELSASLDCAVLGETFDVTFAAGVADGEFELSLLGGTTDPIRIPAPMPDPTSLLGAADARAIATAYGLTAAQSAALDELAQSLLDSAGELGAQGVFVFEIKDFGIRVTSGGGPTVSGDVQLVQLPRFLDALMPLTKLQLGLGAETDKVFVSIEAADSTEPLLTVPVPGGVVDVHFGRFMLAYAWASDVFAFALEAGITPRPTLNLTAGGTGVYLPQATADVEVGATVSAPPVPIPQGVVSFGPSQRAPGDTALDELGLQGVIAAGRSRFVTAYVRELAFSPTFFLLMPGLRADAGLVLGGPDPRDFATADDYLDVRTWDRGAFFARFTVKKGTLLFLEPTIGVLLNPLIVVPPFLTANPPYWITPPMLLGDLYADEIGVSINIPGLVFFDLTFERPLPSFSLQALLELAALVTTGFAHPIAAGSALRKVLFARLSVLVDLRLAGISSAGTTKSLVVELNVADLINGVVDVMHKAKTALDDGSDLVQSVARDPVSLIRMVPLEARRHAHALDIAGFHFSGSVFLLTPEELADELVLFFENKRRKPRGLAANTPPASPPLIAPVNIGAVLTDGVHVVRTNLPDDIRSLLPDVGRLATQSIASGAASRAARAHAIQQLVDGRSAGVDGAAAAIAEQLAKIAPGDSGARAHLLEAFGLSELAAPVEAAVRRQRPGRGVPDARAAAAALRDVLVAAMQARDVGVVGARGLPGPPQEIAAMLAGQVRAGRAASVDSVVPAAGQAELRRSIVDTLGTLERKLGGPASTHADAVSAAERTIADALTVRYGVRNESVGALLQADDPAGLADAIRERIGSSWQVRTPPVTRTVRVGTFDAAHFGRVVGGVGGFRPRVPAPSDTVEEVVGYEIRLRDGGNFSVPVAAPTAAYKVELQDGRYQLFVLGSDGKWQGHELPATLVAAVPDGSGKAAQLRDQLIFASRRARRPRTQAERDAVAEGFEQSDSLYHASVFVRPEYKLKPSGGIHGPFYFADLLRNQASGAYTVPAGPALLAGFDVSLFGNDLAFAGMVVPGDSGPNVFLYGHTVVQAHAGPLALRAEGDFVVGVGDLWQSIPLPGGGVATHDAIGFSGHVALSEGSAKLLEGSASGTFTRDARGSVRASLSVEVSSRGSDDLTVGDTKFARVAWSVDGGVDVQLSEHDLSADVIATASVSVELATYGTRWVVDIPAERVCIPWYYIDSPVSGHWGSMCATTPEVGHPEIDTSTIHWQQLGSAHCRVVASASASGGLSFELDLSALDDSVTDMIGASTLAIPHLL